MKKHSSRKLELTLQELEKSIKAWKNTSSAAKPEPTPLSEESPSPYQEKTAQLLAELCRQIAELSES